MSKEEILSVLSDININSETALEAVSLYVEYLRFEKQLECTIFVTFFGCLFFAVFNIFKAVNKEYFDK